MNSLKKNGLTILVALAIVSCNKTNQQTETTSSESAMRTAEVQMGDDVVIDGDFCFLKTENKDSTKISLSIVGDKVTGTMVWSPYEKDGATGTLSGIRNANGELDLLYAYTIEGSQQTETKVMKIENNQLLIKEGELEDPKNDGNLRYKDVSKAVFSEKILKSKCD
jgi:hypothetical protein